MTHLDPTPIFQMLQANQATAVMKTAIDLGIFAALAGSSTTAADVAGKIGCPPRSTGIILDAMTVLGLAVRRGTSYELSPVANAFLVPGGPTYLGDASNIFAGPMLWNAMGRLTEAVRADGTVMDRHAETPSHDFWETFARSSAAIAGPPAAALVEHVAPRVKAGQPLRVLDVAAGSGIYGHSLLRLPSTEVTFVDWPNVLVETRAWGDRLGVDQARARYLPGSVFDAELGGPYDVVIASHLFHHFDPPTCQALMRRLGGALGPGGLLAVHDFIAGPGPEHAAATMFSLVMLVWTRSGKSYGHDDYAAWMSEAGLSAPVVHSMPGMPSSWLLATSSR